MTQDWFNKIGEGLELLKKGLARFVKREMQAAYKDRWQEVARQNLDRYRATDKFSEWDIQVLLAVMWEHWNDVFRNSLGPTDRSLVQELRDVRNRWAHQEEFSINDTWRALDTMARVLSAVKAKETKLLAEMQQSVLPDLVKVAPTKSSPRKTGKR